MPLEQVKQALADPGSLDELLDRHEACLRERIGECEQALALLAQLREEEEEHVPLTMEVREVPALRSACVELHTAIDRIGLDVGPAYGQLFGQLKAAGMEPSGPGLIGYPEEDFDPEAFTALIAFPIDKDPPAGTGIEVREFPGGKAAFGTVVGPYEHLHQAWQDATAWLSEQGLQFRAMPYEIYRINHSTTSNPEEMETDIVIPVA